MAIIQVWWGAYLEVPGCRGRGRPAAAVAMVAASGHSHLADRHPADLDSHAFKLNTFLNKKKYCIPGFSIFFFIKQIFKILLEEM